MVANADGRGKRLLHVLEAKVLLHGQVAVKEGHEQRAREQHEHLGERQDRRRQQAREAHADPHVERLCRRKPSTA